MNAAEVPLSLTAAAPLKCDPVIVTCTPTPPLTGENPPIVGVRRTVKLVALLTMPPTVVTAMSPVVAPAGTVAVGYRPPY